MLSRLSKSTGCGSEGYARKKIKNGLFYKIHYLLIALVDKEYMLYRVIAL